jgi:hypothetical protein
MLRINLPRRRYNTSDYPYVSTANIGHVIPIGYGTFTDLVPIEINTNTHRYKIVDHAIATLSRVATATKDPLILDTDYFECLTVGEFRLNTNCKLIAGTTYYFSVSADYAIGTDYIGMGQNFDLYADGVSYSVNGSSAWAPTVNALRFCLWGKQTIGGAEEIVASNTTDDEETAALDLRDAAARTKVGQSFKVTVSSYPSKIHFYGITKTVTPPVGNVWVTLYEEVSPESTIGVLSEEKTVLQITGGEVELAFNDSYTAGEPTECDIVTHSPAVEHIADLLPDVIEHIMGKNPAILDATALANLATDRTQHVELHLADTITFGEFLAKLEAGQMWKLIPKQDGTYLTEVYEAGEPANTPHFRDDDFLSFKMELDVGSIKQAVTVFYNQDEVVGDFAAVQVSSQIARFFYMNESELEVETYLKDLADADALADSYLARFEVPIIRIVFEVHGWAVDLLPGRDKVKITRTRAAYAGGTLSGVLFRIEKLVKRPETNTVEITAAVWGNSAT